jgi:hypothetical protein
MSGEVEGMDTNKCTAVQKNPGLLLCNNPGYNNFVLITIGSLRHHRRNQNWRLA